MNSLHCVKSKIVDLIELERVCYRARFFKKKIVFTNGCFDILHKGHIEYLHQAADMGDILIIGLNSDASVSRLKGQGRPVQDQETRAQILASLSCVNYVVLFDEDTPKNLIQLVQPDILVKGGDYADIEKIVGYDIVKQKGGEVIALPFVEGHSTTQILEKIKKL
ncbi:MAG: D-glycero-beta-D-manno-heptose 1-phosphate adenylyltransferase [Bacteroidales bacterium]|nr:D-glycero-beta-D-manno-heptose 1-phosphate adenylyltransferase [Bacteroidales bacterium]